MITALFLYVWK